MLLRSRKSTAYIGWRQSVLHIHCVYGVFIWDMSRRIILHMWHSYKMVASSSTSHWGYSSRCLAPRGCVTVLKVWTGKVGVLHLDKVTHSACGVLNSHTHSSSHTRSQGPIQSRSHDVIIIISKKPLCATFFLIYRLFLDVLVWALLI